MCLLFISGLVCGLVALLIAFLHSLNILDALRQEIVAAIKVSNARLL